MINLRQVKAAQSENFLTLGNAGGETAAVDAESRASAERLRSRLAQGPVAHAEVRAALLAAPPRDRDAWVDLVLGLDELPDDGPALPADGVPYLPCPVDAVVRGVELAAVRADDVLVDVGSGLGRAAIVAHWLTGATVLGLEVQPHLVAASRALIRRVHAERCSVIEGDAAELLSGPGTVFFLYCPFSGARLSRALAHLEQLARTREVRVVCVQVPLPECAWLTPVASTEELVVYRSQRTRESVPATS